MKRAVRPHSRRDLDELAMAAVLDVIARSGGCFDGDAMALARKAAAKAISRARRAVTRLELAGVIDVERKTGSKRSRRVSLRAPRLAA